MNTIERGTRRTKPFVQIDREQLQQNRLSWAATGMYAYLQSLPGDWTLRVSDLVKRKKNGEHATRSIIKELKEHGYIYQETVRDESGKITTWKMVFYEYPEDNPAYTSENDPHEEKPTCGESTCGKSTSGKPTCGKPHPTYKHSTYKTEDIENKRISPADAGALSRKDATGEVFNIASQTGIIEEFKDQRAFFGWVGKLLNTWGIEIVVLAFRKWYATDRTTEWVKEQGKPVVGYIYEMCRGIAQAQARDATEAARKEAEAEKMRPTQQPDFHITDEFDRVTTDPRERLMRFIDFKQYMARKGVTITKDPDQGFPFTLPDEVCVAESWDVLEKAHA